MRVGTRWMVRNEGYVVFDGLEVNPTFRRTFPFLVVMFDMSIAGSQTRAFQAFDIKLVETIILRVDIVVYMQLVESDGCLFGIVAMC